MTHHDAAHIRPFKSVQFAATAPGSRVLILGAVHGNELAGMRGIERAIAEFDAGVRMLRAGRVTFVPITNPKAYALKRRAGDRNLNRNLAPTATPTEYEDHIANWLCPMMAQHDLLLDLHSFQSPGQPFALVGPHNNTDDLQPFAQAALEEAIALRLGVKRIVFGWLDTYARGVQRRKAALAPGEVRRELDAKYGVGTTEYMRTQGGAAITLECGQHDDPSGPEIAYRAIINTLTHLGMIDGEPPQPEAAPEVLRLYEVIDRHAPEDAFARTWASFDALHAGDVIGTRGSGEVVKAEVNGRIVFPNALAAPGAEWFYLAKEDDRFQKVA